MAPRTWGPGSPNPSVQGPAASVDEGAGGSRRWGLCVAVGNPVGNEAPLIVAVREPMRGSLCGERAGPQLRGSITLSPRGERRVEEGVVGQEDRTSPRGTLAFVSWRLWESRRGFAKGRWGRSLVGIRDGDFRSVLTPWWTFVEGWATLYFRVLGFAEGQWARRLDGIRDGASRPVVAPWWMFVDGRVALRRADGLPL